MDRLIPKKNPDAARALLATPDDQLSAADRQRKYVVSLNAAPVACPMCFVPVSLYEAGDENQEVGEPYEGSYVCLRATRSWPRSFPC